MRMYEGSFDIPAVGGHRGLIGHLRKAVRFRIPKGHVPLRFFVTAFEQKFYHCDAGVLVSGGGPVDYKVNSVFDFRQRDGDNAEEFNAVLLIPTGIGSEIGGHAGDATPVARLLGSACDNLILHPNVVNASDINEAPDNAIYVEGSVITRLLMGTAGLKSIHSNRLMAIVDGKHSPRFIHSALNTIDGARATYGLNCERVVLMEPPIQMQAKYMESGLAAGEIEGLGSLFSLLDEYRTEFDAIALTSVIQVPSGYHGQYFKSEGNMVNPWGGVEAMLTHAVSSVYDIPAAHSPMMENDEIANMDTGRVDPRIASETISMSFLNCVLKGLRNSPRIVTQQEQFFRPGVRTAEDVSCLVIPDGCLGLPTLAALEQGIPVIAVEENKNLMNNDLNQLPWATGQFHRVSTYLEAAGVMLALRTGLSIKSLKRPLKGTEISTHGAGSHQTAAIRAGTGDIANKGLSTGR